MSVGDERLDIADLILLGILTREWLEFEEVVAWGLELEREHPSAISEDATQREVNEFRYAHKLISAADFGAWLSARLLTVSDVSQAMRRRLLRRGYPRPGGGQADPARLARVLRAEAYCDGVLGRLATAAIARQGAARILGASESRPGHGASGAGSSARAESALELALARDATGLESLGESALRARLARLCRLDDAYRTLRAQVDEPGAVARCCRAHGLDWIEVRGEMLVLATEGSAREARLLIKEGTATVPEVAERSGGRATECSFYLYEADERLVGMLAGASAGEVIGPWQHGEEWCVMVLHRKIAPSPDNPSLHDRAVDELLDEAVEDAVIGRVRRHDAL